MTETNCDVCLTDDTLTFVSIANTTLTPKKIKIEAIDHSSIYACLDKDPSATLKDNIYATCLSERDPCNYPSVSARGLFMSGTWDVELEDGTVLLGKTLEELSELLLEYEIKLSLGLDCDDFENLPSTFHSFMDLDYEDDRTWEVYINDEFYGKTGDEYEYVEEIVDTHPGLRGSYVDGLEFYNKSSNSVSFVFVANKGNINSDTEFTILEANDSFEYDLKAGVMKFCLSGSGA